MLRETTKKTVQILCNALTEHDLKSTIQTVESDVVRTRSFYLFHCFADNLFVLLLCDFLPLVKGLYGCFHFIYSFLLNLLLLKMEPEPENQIPLKWMKIRREEREVKEEEKKEREPFSDTVPSLSWSYRPEPCCDVRAEWWRTAAPGWGPAGPWSPWQCPLWSALGGGQVSRRPPLISKV